jgi:YbbR domain-containing protein
MIAERMNKIISGKAFYIVFSVIVAITLWAYVEYQENPDVSQSVNGIPVELINGDVVSDRNLVITDVNLEYMMLRFLGKRSVVTKLDSSNVKISVDLAQITGAGRSQLAYTIAYPPDVDTKGLTITSRTSDYITVVVEAQFKRTDIQIEAVKSGAGSLAMEGYLAEQPVFNPDRLTVSGPESKVLSIARAVVNIQRENLVKTVAEDLDFDILDEEGDVISKDNLTFDSEKINVTIPIKMVKSIPLTVNLLYGAGATEANTICSITPDTITLSGDPEALNFNNILLATVDLTKFEKSLTEHYSIVIPNEVTNETGAVEAIVTISVAGVETRHLSATNIQATKVPEGYTARLITQSLDVLFRGRAADLEQITADNVRIVVDLTALGTSAGTSTVPARIYFDGFDNVGAIGEYSVTVNLTVGAADPEPSPSG